MLSPWKKNYGKPRQCIQKQRHYFADRGLSSHSYGFSSSHVQMWELGHKEGWVPKNWCFWTVVLEKTLMSPLDFKEVKPVNPKGNQSWIYIGGTDAEAEAPKLWPPDGKSWLVGKDPDAGKDWGHEEKGWQRIRWLDGITDSMDMSSRKLMANQSCILLWCRNWSQVRRMTSPSQGDIRRCRHMYFLARFETEMIQILRIFWRIELTQRLDQNSFSLLFG